jgi:acyl-CoA synthetase (AMP-forming)/AMP-acid ligase II
VTSRGSGIFERLEDCARRYPQRDALVFAPEAGRYAVTSYAELHERALELERGCRRLGVRPHDRIVFWNVVDPDAVALLFALFAIGAMPAFVDPSTPTAELDACLDEIRPDGFIGIHRAHLLRLRHRRAFSNLRYAIVGRRFSWLPLPSYRTLTQASGKVEYTAEPARPAPWAGVSEPGEFISYTTGTTGKPKGVVYTRGMVQASISAWSALELREEGDRNLSFIPLFSLLDMCLGVTAVLPRLDPRRPLAFDPLQLVRIMHDHRVTRSFASPRITEKLTQACFATGQTLPAMRVFMVGGANVEESVLEGANRILPNGEAYVFYGATEALPISLTPSSKVLSGSPSLSDRGERGFLVGRPLGSIQACVARVTPCGERDAAWEELPPGEVGELLVTGPNVSRAYLGDAESTARSKIQDGFDCWHRMGDLAYRDGGGNLYLCGRAGDRIEYAGRVFHAAPVERLFSAHPRVFRTALIHGPGGAPVIAVEPVAGAFPRDAVARQAFRRELRELAATHALLDGLGDFFFCPRFPMDTRHGSKVQRRLLERDLVAGGRRRAVASRSATPVGQHPQR